MKFYANFFDWKNFKPGWKLQLQEWHPTLPLLAAVLTLDVRTCKVYLIEKNDISSNQKIERKKSILSRENDQLRQLCWHPSNIVFLVQWESGLLNLVHDDGESKVKVIESPHSAPLLILKWNNLGSRAISVDQNGLVVFWRVFAGNQMQILTKYQRPEELSHAVMVDGSLSDQRNDITELAKAAIAGDESALDALGPRVRPKTGRAMPASIVMSKGLTAVYVVTVSGTIVYAEESGASSELVRLGSGIMAASYEENHGLLVVVSVDFCVNVFRSSVDGTLEEISRVKLSRWRNGNLHINWLYHSCPIVLVSTGSLTLRLWDPFTNDSTVLNVETDDYHKAVEFVTAVDSHISGRLAVGTSLGTVFIFECSGNNPVSDGCWKTLPVISVNNEITRLCWSRNEQPLLSVFSSPSVTIFREHHAQHCFSEMISVIQSGPSSLQLKNLESEKEFVLTVEYCIQKIATSTKAFLLWNGQRVIVYEAMWDLGRAKVIGSFAFDRSSFDISTDIIYTLEHMNVVIRSLNGDIKQTISFSQSEGLPTLLACNTGCAACVTNTGILKVWSRNEEGGFILHCQPKPLYKDISGLTEIRSLGVSSTGSFISVLLTRGKENDEQELVIFNPTRNSFKTVDFSGKELPTRTDRRLIETVYWDTMEPRVFVCQVSYWMDGKQSKYVTSFVSPLDGDAYIQELVPIDSTKTLCGVHLPHFAMFFDEDGTRTDTVTAVLPDFEGFKEDEGSVPMLIDFSLYLHEGDLDKAFRAIRNIKSQTIWRKLARLCILTRQVEAALMCASYVGLVNAIWSADAEKDEEGKLIVLAVHFDMIVEAIDMCHQFKRYDWLLKLYQSTNRWDETVAVCESQSTLDKKLLYYQYGKYLELTGMYIEAMTYYEMAGCAAKEISRVFKEKDQELENYCKRSNDSEVLSWYAKYLESHGDFATALDYYKKCGDIVSLCRSLCCRNEVEAALDIAWKSNNAAACYFMGRHLEVSADDFEKACQYYTKAGAYGTAVRLCKEYGMDGMIYSVALQASPKDQLDAATYLESRPATGLTNAARLYSKAGYPLKALELATSDNSPDLVHDIMNNIPSTLDRQMALKVAVSMEANSHWSAAIKMYAMCGEVSKALALAKSYNVRVTSELSELLNPPEELDQTERYQLFEDLANLCLNSDLYNEAAQKYNQIGNKMAAVAALEKLGDPDKVILYALAARSADVYASAANYLQSENWRENVSFEKNIVHFYTKAKAYGQLVTFYIVAAQSCIEDFQNFLKSLDYAREAVKMIEKAKDFIDSKEELLMKVNLLEELVEVYESSKAPREKFETLRELQSRLQQICDAGKLKKGNLLPPFLRKEDLSACIIQELVELQDFSAAFSECEKVIREGGKSLEQVIGSEKIELIEKRSGKSLN